MPKGSKRKRAAAAAPVAAAGPATRNHVLRREGTRKHATFSPKTDTKSSGFIEPISGTDLNKDHVIQFEFVTMGGYWLLPEDPIFASYKVRFTNQGAVAAPATGADSRTAVQKVAKSAYYDGTSLELACGAHLNPHLGLAGFFSGAEVTVNGETVSTADYGQNFYQTLNRGFTSKKLRRRYTGSDAELLPKGTETDMEKWPAGYKAGIAMLDVGGATADDSNYIGQRFSIDSAFLLSCPKNLTLLSVNESKGIGSEAVQAYTLLKPGTKVCIKLFKTDPGGRNVGNYNSHTTTGGYSSSTDMGSTDSTSKKEIMPKAKYLEAVLELSQLNIMYEVYNFVDTPKSIAGINIKYTKDSFRLQTQNLPSDQREVKKSFEISGNTKIAYIFFPWHFQLHFDPTTKKATEYMLDFPANLHNITVYLNSRPYRWTNGLTGLADLDTTKTNAASLAKPSYGHSFANLYFKEQSKLGILDNDFNEIFPKVGQRWKDVLVLEFTEDKLEKLNTLRIDCLFDQPYSPAKRMIACMTVFEEDIIDRGGVWMRKVHKS